ncbi:MULTISPECIES: outer membrane protein assembly factor BamE [unclassified Thalassotalea]|uniref:outer membrane protein assembly factor BamE n=1 Tax=unclassified Thalassotalea TaxID=2614972 RepID=UPI0010803C42|nr:MULTISPECIES: outer membrane protein assembly factor BamE [unclassified Thalassotalea]NMP14898.1 outer membrane protein assembly factor BamE [Thalassotalea sp. Y01]QBY03459.1 outer membrane protein assembly factor BamE [Thalassotalea sp. HSM 43]
MLRALIIGAAICLTSACVYRIDVPQGNYIEQKQIDKLQVGMTKEQVKFVLGNPVIRDTFNDDTWYYVYEFLSGKGEEYDKRRRLELNFDGDKLVDAKGDFEIKESFYVPIEE